MSEPIKPADTLSLGKLVRTVFQEHGISSRVNSWDDISEERRRPHVAAAASVAHAVCPPDHVVVRTDDLRQAVAALMLMETSGPACDRLIRVLNGESA